MAWLGWKSRRKICPRWDSILQPCECKLTILPLGQLSRLDIVGIKERVYFTIMLKSRIRSYSSSFHDKIESPINCLLTILFKINLKSLFNKITIFDEVFWWFWVPKNKHNRHIVYFYENCAYFSEPKNHRHAPFKIPISTIPIEKWF